MTSQKTEHVTDTKGLTKTPTGIQGFDDMAQGGLPVGRTTVVVGNPGAGKTIFGLQFAVTGIRQHNEPAIFVSFEEAPTRILANAAGFAWNIAELADKSLILFDTRISPDAVQSGNFDLLGLLAMVQARAELLGVRRIVIDGIDAILGLLDNINQEQRELSRLQEWMDQTGMTGVVTCKTLVNTPRHQQRFDYMHYLSDCVVLLENEIYEAIYSRTLRIVKYRGSGYITGKHPLAFTPAGLDIILTQGVQTQYPVYDERVSCGIPSLDKLCGGGYIRGTSVLVSGAPGTAKTTLGGALALAACERGEKVLFVSLDDSGDRIVSNLRSIDIELGPHVDARRLHVTTRRVGGRSPEEHYIAIRTLILEHEPRFLILDPLSALMDKRYPFSEAVCEGLIHFAKARGITLMCTSLLQHQALNEEATISQVSTIADTWIHLSYHARGGERNRALTIIKSRGTKHSNQVRELRLSDQGIDLAEVYSAEGEVLMGTARVQKEMEDRHRQTEERNAFQRRRLEAEKQETELTARLQTLQQELERKRQELELLKEDEQTRIDYESFSESERKRLRQPDG